MHLGNYQNLVLLFLCIPVGLMLWFIVKVKHKRILMFLGPQLGQLFWNKKFNVTGAFYKAILLMLSIITIIFALCRPRWGFVWEEISTTGADIVIAIDISKSMLANDVKPNRLTVAQRKLIDLLNILQDDRIALVAFAGYAVNLCPLTNDYEALAMFSDYLSPSLISLGGTNIADAIEVSTQILKNNSPQESIGKFIILITDGENTSTVNPLEAAKKALENNIKIFTIGIGTLEATPIPQEDGSFARDQQGNIVLSKLDRKTLQEIAQLTHGNFVLATINDVDLQQIYKNYIRQDVYLSHTSNKQQNKQKVWSEKFQWFILLALCFLFTEGLIKEFYSTQTYKKKFIYSNNSMNALLICVLGALLFRPTIAFSSLQEAFKAYEKKDYDKALKEFEAAEIENPDSLELSYNKAVAAYKAQDYQKAKSGFEKATRSSNKDLAAKSYFNLGNTYVALSDLQNAIKAYEKALELNPKDEDAKENLEYVKKLLKENQHKQQNENNADQNQSNQNQQSKDREQTNNTQTSSQYKNNVQPNQQANNQDQQQIGKNLSQDSNTPQQNEPYNDKLYNNKQSNDESSQNISQSGSQENTDPQAHSEQQTQIMDKYQAEQLLKTVPDQIQKYIYKIPNNELNNKKQKLQNNKDW